MSGFISDPELDQLVAEVNTAGDDSQSTATRHLAFDASPEPSSPERTEIRYESVLGRLLREMVRHGASDLLLVPGSAPAIRLHGRIRPLAFGRLETGEVERFFRPHLDGGTQKTLREEGNADFSLRLHRGAGVGEDGASGWRLRVNLQRQRGDIAAGIRLLPDRIPSLTDLRLPPGLLDLVQPDRGLVIISGPTGSGKTTTLATMVDHLNRNGTRHIITIEDPVEYEHRSRDSLVEHVEVGTDAPSFAGALRAALRRDPDVILVGEMRDLETISTVLTAAETGHLILSTLHTADATRAVHRIVDVFPANQQEQIRHQLALGLGGIVCQQLVPALDGKGRWPALEVLIGTNAVRNLIRKQQVHMLYNEMMSGSNRGMIQMEASLAELVLSGKIDPDEARIRANRLDELDRRLLQGS